jgi:hypothetical protein
MVIVIGTLVLNHQYLTPSPPLTSISRRKETPPPKSLPLLYEGNSDLVRNGSKKLRESKSLLDNALLSYNGPMVVPGYILSPRENQQ